MYSVFSTAENLQRLEELPSFISCIKPFGKPILPPLLTLHKKNEISQYRTAAIEREAKVLQKRKKLFNVLRKEKNIYTNNEKYPAAFEECDSLYAHLDGSDALLISESSLSQKDHTPAKSVTSEIHVAMSKIPTNDICSTVHKGAIVCSNIVSNHKYRELTRDSATNSVSKAVSCTECSLLDCHLCQIECSQDFTRNRFLVERNRNESSEALSLKENARESDDDQNSVIEETECSSLPTVIYNKKIMINDTDSESNITSLTQSTDLEKYMDFPFELYSPDCSVSEWESKATNQQSIASKSDDASSETIVNTENELTPCASMLAEFTDSIEDQLSCSSDTKQHFEAKTEQSSEFHRRAHSVDSYMKLLKTCAQNLYVRKSQSEPSHADISHMINSKEEFSLNLPGSVAESTDETESLKNSKVNVQNINYDVFTSSVTSLCSVSSDSSLVSKADGNQSLIRRHVRRNSYTLEQPSSALIKAHADCECNLDAERYCSPHCSSFESSRLSNPVSAFRKEKLNVVLSPRRAKRFQIQNSAVSGSDVALQCNASHICSSTTDFASNECNAQHEQSSCDTRLVSKAESEKNNLSIPSESAVSDYAYEKYSADVSKDPDMDEKLVLSKIYHDLQEEQKMKVEKLLQEQNKQWLKLHEEFKKQERLLCEKLKIFEIAESDADYKHLNSDHPQACEHNVKEGNTSVLDPSKSHLFSFQNKEKNTCPELTTSENCDISEEILASNEKIIMVLRGTESSVTASSAISVSDYEFYKQEILQNTISEVPVETEYKVNEKRHSDSSTDIHSSTENEKHISEHFKTENIKENADMSVAIAMSSSSGDVDIAVEEITPAAMEIEVSHGSEISTTLHCEEAQDNLVMINGFSEHEVPGTHYLASEKCSTRENTNAIDNKNFPENEVNETGKYSSNSDVMVSGGFSDMMATVNNSSNKSDGLENRLVTPESSVDLNSKLQSSELCKSADEPDFACNKSNFVSEKGESQTMKIAKLPVSMAFSHIHSKIMKQNTSLSAKEMDTINKLKDPLTRKKFERLPALVKGYLTRRLFKTERVQGLIKTLQDTAVLIKKLSDDLSSKGNTVSERDVDFHRQLIVQLMTTFHSVYDIFCTISTKERMDIIAESRNFLLKQNKKAEQSCNVDPVVASKAPTTVLNKKHKLSSATLKSLERKKRSPIDSRTYTIEDFKCLRKRPCSSILSKSSVPSPSRIYKVSVGLSPKRKTISLKKPSASRRLCLK